MDSGKKYNIHNLSPEKPKWKNLPTKAVRIPEIFAPRCIEMARLLDAGGEIEKFLEEIGSGKGNDDVEKFLEEKSKSVSLAGVEKFLEEKSKSVSLAGVEKFLEENNTSAIAEPQSSSQITSAQVINDILELVAKTLDLENCLNLQSELGKIIEEKREQAKDPRLEQAILYLAGLCDGAESEDGKEVEPAV
jgi:hypothetical protein